MTKTEYRSEIAQAMHETIAGMHRLDVVDKQTMRGFDARFLTPVEDLTAQDVIDMREKAGISQAVFARALNITTDYVSKIERGIRQPSGATLKLLSLVRRKGFEAVL